MQLIDIDKIIGKIKLEIKLSSHLYKDKTRTLDEFLVLSTSPIIYNNTINIKKIKSTNKDILKTYEQFIGDTQFYKKIRIKFIQIILDEIKYCPYCGKIPLIFYGEGSSKIKWFEFRKKETKVKRNFDFEHFFEKTDYNSIAMSFYNLIPVCSFCNQRIKGAKNPLEKMKNGETIFHPYFGWIESDNNEIIIKGGKFGDKFDFQKKKSINSSHSKFFKLNEIYLNSQDTENDISFIRESKEKILATQQINLNKDKTNEELKKYFFKNYAPQSENEILKFSNGKFKKDLIDNLKLPNN